jgi:hypothetical protein
MTRRLVLFQKEKPMTNKENLILEILQAIKTNKSSTELERMLIDLYMRGYRLGYLDGKEVGDFDDE